MHEIFTLPFLSSQVVGGWVLTVFEAFTNFCVPPLLSLCLSARPTLFSCIACKVNIDLQEIFWSVELVNSGVRPIFHIYSLMIHPHLPKDKQVCINFKFSLVTCGLCVNIVHLRFHLFNPKRRGHPRPYRRKFRSLTSDNMDS